MNEYALSMYNKEFKFICEIGSKDLGYILEHMQGYINCLFDLGIINLSEYDELSVYNRKNAAKVYRGKR